MTTAEALAVVREALEHPAKTSDEWIDQSADARAALALIEERLEDEGQQRITENVYDLLVKAKRKRNVAEQRVAELEAALREIAQAAEADLDYLREQWRGTSFVIPETTQKLAEALVIARRALGGGE